MVDCKDTPNFIGNRIGSFVGGTVQKLTVEDDYSIEEVDALTGNLIGLPKSGSYRLLDIVGLDIWAHVSRNLYEGVPGDPWRERFRMQPFLQTMIERPVAGRQDRSRLLQEGGAGREARVLGDRLEDAGVSRAGEGSLRERRRGEAPRRLESQAADAGGRP